MTTTDTDQWRKDRRGEVELHFHVGGSRHQLMVVDESGAAEEALERADLPNDLGLTTAIAVVQVVHCHLVVHTTAG